MGFMCGPTDEEAAKRASTWTFFRWAISYYGRQGITHPGQGNLWEEYLEWQKTDAARDAFKLGLIGSPATLRAQLRQLQDAHVDQVMLLCQAGKNKHEDICASLKLFAEEVMPEFHAEEPAHQAWKKDVLAGRIHLADLDTTPYDLYAHQNTPDAVRPSQDDLVKKMAEKEKSGKAA